MVLAGSSCSKPSIRIPHRIPQLSGLKNKPVQPSYCRGQNLCISSWILLQRMFVLLAYKFPNGFIARRKQSSQQVVL
ncbi:unnamed protein product, partial [Vitis vinifera]|uniref:Uncharacterized protein n=1 Tax=Vitis vinifera TaxID=29760 RepID=E0CUF7_VITVI